MKPLLQVEGLTVEFGNRPLWGRAHRVKAVDGVDFELARGETLGLVGESGSGKSTLARAVVRLISATGSVRYQGAEVLDLKRSELSRFRRRVQFVFQDPFSSLNPRHRVGSIVAEPLLIHGLCDRTAAQRKVEELFERVGLSPSMTDRYPHQFSGGQRQRIGIARALATEPELLICDEPVSALDVSIQAQILNLLQDLCSQMGLSMLFISHDLAVVRQVCDRVAVMFLGRLVEVGTARQICSAPRHPYTQALVASAPRLDRKVSPPPSEGEVTRQGSGCLFAPRCPKAEPFCRKEIPVLAEKSKGNLVACHRVGEES